MKSLPSSKTMIWILGLTAITVALVNRTGIKKMLTGGS